ncbi:hypothetical protein CEXT_14741 [Caerostris extrusa]|uniref:Uncharacterized protein n=1 Tax=Caerostris extrusa TaxID=172846 RepID=A0AAV4Y662_CAEEX|nr:hypothetical protein CEXT_14741 [Caerostris extrusa]
MESHSRSRALIEERSSKHAITEPVADAHSPHISPGTGTESCSRQFNSEGSRQKHYFRCQINYATKRKAIGRPATQLQKKRALRASETGEQLEERLEIFEYALFDPEEHCTLI